MQLSLRCKFCQYITISDKEEDIAVEIDAYEEELRFVCRKCKKENKLKLTNNKKSDPLPKIGLSRF